MAHFGVLLFLTSSVYDPIILLVSEIRADAVCKICPGKNACTTITYIMSKIIVLQNIRDNVDSIHFSNHFDPKPVAKTTISSENVCVIGQKSFDSQGMYSRIQLKEYITCSKTHYFSENKSRSQLKT